MRWAPSAVPCMETQTQQRNAAGVLHAQCCSSLGIHQALLGVRPRTHLGIVRQGVPRDVPLPDGRLDAGDRCGIGALHANARGAVQEKRYHPALQATAGKQNSRAHQVSSCAR